jgi:hypothetical protein
MNLRSTLEPARSRCPSPLLGTSIELTVWSSLPLLPPREERAGERRALETERKSPLPDPLPATQGAGKSKRFAPDLLNSTRVPPLWERVVGDRERRFMGAMRARSPRRSLLVVAALIWPLTAIGKEAPESSATSPLREQASSALRRGVEFFRKEVAVEGTYLWLCFLSPRRRSGERTEVRGIQGPPLPGPLLHPMEERESLRFRLGRAVLSVSQEP